MHDRPGSRFEARRHTGRQGRVPAEAFGEAPSVDVNATRRGQTLEELLESYPLQMDVTVESEEQTRDRLLLVLAAAVVHWLAGEYSFTEVQTLELALKELAEALAVVRDDAQWSILKPADVSDLEKFCIFTCHFQLTFPIAALWVGLPLSSKDV